MESLIESSVSQLAALQSIDRQLREKSELQQTLQKEIADLEVRLQQQRDLTAASRLERDSADSQRRDLESRIDTEGAKMKDRRMRLNRVRNEKELQTLRHEIEVGKEANQQLEEEYLRVLESAEGSATAAAEAEKLLSELEATVAGRVEECRQLIGRLEQEMQQFRDQRAQMIDGLDVVLLRKYEQIFQRRGGTAVVEVRNATCLGCHMHLPPQFFNELQRSRDVRLCPNCHRILYWRSEGTESVERSR